MMKKYLNLIFVVVFFSLKICNSQELEKAQLSQKERQESVIEKYIFSGSEESIILLLYQNGAYSYNSFTNIIGERFSEGYWIRTGKILELNSSYGANRLPIYITYTKVLDKPNKIGIQGVININGDVLENAIIAVNNDSTKCSTIMDTCLGSFHKIERVRVFLSKGDCFSNWIEVNQMSLGSLSIVVQSAIDFDKYLVFNNRKYCLSGKGLNQIMVD